mmetsp:Transcript_24434/g.38071  ORF Transcript_24434/g.38071 Transcript_24434/m.38071 type:complete len:124 (-) Transcript_24434:199-570(-)
MRNLSVEYPYLTRFERSQILSERANQLSNGASPKATNFLPLDDPLTIAMRELLENKIPMKVRRVHSDRASFEDIEISNLAPDPTGEISSFIQMLDGNAKQVIERANSSFGECAHDGSEGDEST